MDPAAGLPEALRTGVVAPFFGGWDGACPMSRPPFSSVRVSRASHSHTTARMPDGTSLFLPAPARPEGLGLPRPRRADVPRLRLEYGQGQHRGFGFRLVPEHVARSNIGKCRLR